MSFQKVSVSEAIDRRMSVRAFLPDPVSLETVREILDVARRSPSGGNLQPWNLDVLAGEGYIRGYSLVEKPGAFPEFEIELKYFDGEPVIAEIARVSKPGRRVYSKIKELPRFYAGLGVSILSTPRGVMSDAEARAANVGGEVLCRVF